MTIHKQFVNTYAQMLNDLLLKKLKNRSKQASPPEKKKAKINTFCSVLSFLDSMIFPL